MRQIDELIAATGERPAVNQIPWSPSRYDPALLAAHADRGVAVEGYSPLKGTRLRDPRPGRDRRQARRDARPGGPALAPRTSASPSSPSPPAPSASSRTSTCSASPSPPRKSPASTTSSPASVCRWPQAAGIIPQRVADGKWLSTGVRAAAELSTGAARGAAREARGRPPWRDRWRRAAGHPKEDRDEPGRIRDPRRLRGPGPDSAQTKDGTLVTDLRVGTTPRVQDRATNEWRDADTSYFNVNCWRRLGDQRAGQPAQGRPGRGQGAVPVPHVRGQERVPRTVIDIVADTVGHDLNRGVANYMRQQRPRPPTATRSPERRRAWPTIERCPRTGTDDRRRGDRAVRTGTRRPERSRGRRRKRFEEDEAADATASAPPCPSER